MSPPKEEAALQHVALLSKLSRAEYHALEFIQYPFESVFWRIEQSKARIQDSIANRESRDP